MKTLAMLFGMGLVAVIPIPDDADAAQCGAAVSTTDKAHHRAQRGWDSRKLVKRLDSIERVRRQARCVPDGKPERFVRGQIHLARKQYKHAKKEARLEKLYDRLTAPPGQSWLASVRSCESGGNYGANTGNGFYGAYQFDAGTWSSTSGAYKATGWPESSASLPHLGSNEQQDIRASILYRQRGSSPWPNCG